jgi:hypothetical protein
VRGEQLTVDDFARIAAARRGGPVERSSAE